MPYRPSLPNRVPQHWWRRAVVILPPFGFGRSRSSPRPNSSMPVRGMTVHAAAMQPDGELVLLSAAET
jgi:hypothetical protein